MLRQNGTHVEQRGLYYNGTGLRLSYSGNYRACSSHREVRLDDMAIALNAV